MVSSMVKAHTSMPIKIHTQDGGCSVKNMAKALTLITKQEPS